MKIAEPTTSITDILIAVEAAFLGGILIYRSDQRSVAFWGIALCLLAASAAIGALYHAWTPEQGPPIRNKMPIAIASMMLLALTFMLYGGVASSFTGNIRTVAFILVHVSAAFAFFKLPSTMNKLSRERPSRLGIGVVWIVFLLILLAQHVYNGPEAGTWIAAGGIACMTGTWAQASGYRLHKHMNHNDISHVFFLVGIYLLYRGGALLLDK